jgi:glutamate:GABA antiporter
VSLDPAVEITVRAAEEKRKLRREFRFGDMFFFYIAAVVVIDTIGQVAANGAQGFTWLIFLGLIWFVPFALITAELGSAFPEEGGPYVWARLAFGRLVGALTSVVYWVSVPLWLGGSLVIVSLTAIEQTFGSITGIGRDVYGVMFIWFAVGASIVGFKTGKWLINLGGFLRIVLLGFFSVSVLIYAAAHGIHGVSGRDFLPSYATFIAVVPVLVFNFTGLELGSTASEEMLDPQRDVPRVITRSALAAMLLYGIPILAILVVLPAGQVTGVSGFLGAARAVFTVYGGSVSPAGTVHLAGAGILVSDLATLLFVFGLLTSGSSWLMGSDRALAVASFEGSGPAALGVISARTGTPVRVNLLSGVVSTITMMLAFILTGDNPNKYFQAMLGLTISTSLIAYLGVFPAVVKLRYAFKDTARPYRIPGGMAVVWICSALTTFWCLFGTLVLVWPGFGLGWFGSTGHPNDALSALSFGGQRLQYELTQIVPLLLIGTVGIVFYAMGRTERV